MRMIVNKARVYVLIIAAALFFLNIREADAGNIVQKGYRGDKLQQAPIVQKPSEYKLIIEQKDGKYCLVDRDSKKEFVLRGFYYTKIHPDHPHVVFEPGLYNAEETERVLNEAKDNGYNVVNVPIDAIGHKEVGIYGVGGPNGHGYNLWPEYMANVIDFLERAYRLDIIVYLSLDNWAWSDVYWHMIGEGEARNEYPMVGPYNEWYMKQYDIDVKCQYLIDFLNMIKEHNRDLLNKVIVDLQGDICVVCKYLPFTINYHNYNGIINTSMGNINHQRVEERRAARRGNSNSANDTLENISPEIFHNENTLVNTAAGIFDFSRIEERRACVRENFIKYLNAANDAVKSVNPDIITTIRLFAPCAVNKDKNFTFPPMSDDIDSRFPLMLETALETRVDCIGLNIYPDSRFGDKLTDQLGTYLDSFCFYDTVMSKPCFVGEFGIFRSQYSNLREAAEAAAQWQVETAKKGFIGWSSYWVWNEDEYGLEEFYHFQEIDPLTETSWILLYLSPNYRPDPAKPLSLFNGSYVGLNLTLNQSFYSEGDQFTLELNTYNNTSSVKEANLYIAFEMDNQYWFYPGWGSKTKHQYRQLPANHRSSESILSFTWPSDIGAGNGKFLAGFFDVNTGELIGEVIEKPFSWTGTGSGYQNSPPWMGGRSIEEQVR